MVPLERLANKDLFISIIFSMFMIVHEVIKIDILFKNVCSFVCIVVQTSNFFL